MSMAPTNNTSRLLGSTAIDKSYWDWALEKSLSGISGSASFGSFPGVQALPPSIVRIIPDTEPKLSHSAYTQLGSDGAQASSILQTDAMGRTYLAPKFAPSLVDL